MEQLGMVYATGAYTYYRMPGGAVHLDVP